MHNSYIVTAIDGNGMAHIRAEWEVAPECSDAHLYQLATDALASIVEDAGMVTLVVTIKLCTA